MNNTPTPRTDALWQKLPFDDRYATVGLLRDFARQLERELAEQCTLLGKSAEREADLLGKAERLKRDIEALNEFHLQAVHECDALKEQNAELARKVAEGESTINHLSNEHLREGLRLNNEVALTVRMREALEMAQERIAELSRWANIPNEGQTNDEIRAAIDASRSATKDDTK